MSKQVRLLEIPGQRYRCPCCRHHTLRERGGDEICPVCFWHDDGQDDPYTDEIWGGPNGMLSLTQAGQNYRRMGACDDIWRRYVRAPLPGEM